LGEIAEAPLARVLVVNAVGEDVPASLAALRALAATTTGVWVLAVVSPNRGASLVSLLVQDPARHRQCLWASVSQLSRTGGRSSRTGLGGLYGQIRHRHLLLLCRRRAAPCYFLSPGGWYRDAGRSGPNAASARSAALPIAVIHACRASRSSR
jgi:hypothetical protein